MTGSGCSQNVFLILGQKCSQNTIKDVLPRSASELPVGAGTSGSSRDFRCRKTKKLPTSHSQCHVGQNYDGH